MTRRECLNKRIRLVATGKDGEGEGGVFTVGEQEKSLLGPLDMRNRHPCQGKKWHQEEEASESSPSLVVGKKTHRPLFEQQALVPGHEKGGWGMVQQLSGVPAYPIAGLSTDRVYNAAHNPSGQQDGAFRPAACAGLLRDGDGDGNQDGGAGAFGGGRASCCDAKLAAWEMEEMPDERRVSDEALVGCLRLRATVEQRRKMAHGLRVPGADGILAREQQRRMAGWMDTLPTSTTLPVWRGPVVGLRGGSGSAVAAKAVAVGWLMETGPRAWVSGAPGTISPGALLFLVFLLVRLLDEWTKWACG
ncbi:hypothetical protein DFH27DRAFT_613144 [Peziza echinospora]|nr:hypothetical protein DFH27DRAFT_613144 [Peziza echinospora]